MRQHGIGVLVVVTLLFFGLAACGSDDGGKGGQGAKTPGASGKAKDDEKMRKFAACMRSNGVDMPDPQGGKMVMSQGPGDNPNKMKAAQEKCKSLLPNGGQPPKLSAEDKAKMREFAKCMRAHGVDMEDPGDDGGIRIKSGGKGKQGEKGGPGSLEDKKMQAAEKACQKLQPTPKG